MRVELVHAPGSSCRKARNTIETVIAEEGLPISVECVEEDSQVGGSWAIRIDGEAHSSPKGNHIEVLRDILCRKWKELTETPLLGI